MSIHTHPKNVTYMLLPNIVMRIFLFMPFILSQNPILINLGRDGYARLVRLLSSFHNGFMRHTDNTDKLLHPL